MTCPLEKKVESALKKSGVVYLKDGSCIHKATKNLDFYLPEKNVYIEICRYYTPRKIEQSSRVKNLILLQGEMAVDLFCTFLHKE